MSSTRRRKSNSPVIKALEGSQGQLISKHKGKQYHAARGAVGQTKDEGARKAGKQQQKQQEDQEVELTEEMLQKLLLGAAEKQQQQTPPRTRVVAEGVTTDLKTSAESRSWKARIAHEKRNAVVKILSQVIQFDWEHPYKPSDDAQAIGSGFFVSTDGLIVTNAHVIEEAAKVWITVPAHGETRYEAEVLGVCFDADLAVLRSKSAPVSVILELGNSNDVQYGQEVLTLGYPLGMESLKLTEGIISGRQDSLFQTDAPLNPGNSGGPLISEDGKVIGINVAIVEQSQNVGFAIPVFYLQQLFSSMTSRPSGKRVIHKPILGGEFCNSSDAIQDFIGCDNVTGVYVRQTFEGFPLHSAGVRAGDILVKFNGFDLDNFGDTDVPWSPYAKVSLDSLVSLLTPESKPEVEYLSASDTKIHKVTLSLEDPNNKGYPILPRVREYYPPYEKIDYEVIAGLVVMELTLNHITSFHEDANEAVIRFLTPVAADFTKRLKPEIVVSNVLGGSSIQLGESLTAGTLISVVNGVKCSDLESFRAAIAKPVLKNGKYFITFKSDQNEFVALRLRDVIVEEFELARNYMYNPTVILKEWIENEELMSKVFEDKETLVELKEQLNEFFESRHRRGGAHKKTEKK